MTISRYFIKANIRGKIKIALVSDLHNEKHDNIISIIKQENVDFVAVTGDFVHNSTHFSQGIEFLKKSAKIAPSFCSIGNHEFKFKGDLVSLVKNSGAVLLDNDAVAFRDIVIGGLSSGFKRGKQGYFKKTPSPNISWLSKFSENECYKLLLSHHPEYYPKYIKRLPINLVLSGHAHGGQWRFFNQGAYAPGQGIFPEYTSGIHDECLIITRGIGNPHRVPRINNEPEVVIIELYPGK